MKELTLYEKICRLNIIAIGQNRIITSGNQKQIEIHWKRTDKLQTIIVKQLYRIQAQTKHEDLI